MRNSFTQEQLDYILDLHAKWVANEPDGVFAELDHRCIAGLDLSGRVLTCINFYRSNLMGCNLAGSKLTSANLEMASLDGANLEGANLELADLTMANLESANLRNVTAVRTKFRYADLCKADVSGVVFVKCDLYGAVTRDITGTIVKQEELV